MKIGLYFGTFNPIHIGHLIIANHMAEHSDLDQIWMIVTPHNPLKQKNTLLNDYQRLHLVFLATEDYPKIKPSDIEFKLSQPNYTVNTLAELCKAFPNDTFVPIIGGDNLQSFHLWKDYETILNQHQVFVYRRAGYHENPLLANHPKIKIFEVPLLNISSTYIREMLQAGKSVKYLVPEKVEEYINQHKLYR